MKKIIFVCTGNTCRSPMAEQLFKKKLHVKGISGKEIQVSSAGIAADSTQTVNPAAVAALKEMGISLSAKQHAKQLTQKMVNDQTVLIAMTQEHKQWIKNLPHAYALSDFDSGTDIPDPFGQSKHQYDIVAHMLDFILDEVLEKVLHNQL